MHTLKNPQQILQLQQGRTLESPYQIKILEQLALLQQALNETYTEKLQRIERSSAKLRSCIDKAKIEVSNVVLKQKIKRIRIRRDLKEKCTSIRDFQPDQIIDVLIVKIVEYDPTVKTFKSVKPQMVLADATASVDAHIFYKLPFKIGDVLRITKCICHQNNQRPKLWLTKMSQVQKIDDSFMPKVNTNYNISEFYQIKYDQQEKQKNQEQDNPQRQNQSFPEPKYQALQIITTTAISRYKPKVITNIFDLVEDESNLTIIGKIVEVIQKSSQNGKNKLLVKLSDRSASINTVIQTYLDLKKKDFIKIVNCKTEVVNQHLLLMANKQVSIEKLHKDYLPYVKSIFNLSQL